MKRIACTIEGVDVLIHINVTDRHAVVFIKAMETRRKGEGGGVVRV